MVAGWLGPSSPPHSWSPSSFMDSGSLPFSTKNSFFPPPRAAYWGCSIKSQLCCFWRFSLSQNVASFSYSFGILLPGIADRFNVGRAEAGLTYSLMIFITDGSGRHYCAMKSLSFHLFWFFTNNPPPLQKKIKTQSFCNVAKNIHCISFIIFL